MLWSTVTPPRTGSILIGFSQIEWVGFDVFSDPAECVGAVQLRNDREPLPFDAVILALSASDARAAAPTLKRLLGGLPRECAVVRVIAELGEDRFYHHELGVRHAQLVDLGVSFISFGAPLQRSSRGAGTGTGTTTTTTFRYLAPSAVLLSGEHPALKRSVTTFPDSATSTPPTSLGYCLRSLLDAWPPPPPPPPPLAFISASSLPHQVPAR
jgi:hypothetical protein|eukprot:COSAG01_NODE_13555_length_1568_cov_1.244384_2_plen_212_part_00